MDSSHPAGQASPLPELITEYIRNNPGAQLYKIVEGVTASRGAVTYHLRALAANGVIRVHKETKSRRYYLHSFAYSAETAVLKTFCENETKAAVIRTVQENPGLSRKEIAEQTGIPENTLYRHIASLTDAEILTRERDGHKWRYSVSKKAEKNLR